MFILVRDNQNFTELLVDGLLNSILYNGKSKRRDQVFFFFFLQPSEKFDNSEQIFDKNEKGIIRMRKKAERC